MKRRAPADRQDVPPLDLLYPPAPPAEADPRKVLRPIRPALREARDDAVMEWHDRLAAEHQVAIAAWCEANGWTRRDFSEYRWSAEARERLRAEGVERPRGSFRDW